MILPCVRSRESRALHDLGFTGAGDRGRSRPLSCDDVVYLACDEGSADLWCGVADHGLPRSHADGCGSRSEIFEKGSRRRFVDVSAAVAAWLVASVEPTLGGTSSSGGRKKLSDPEGALVCQQRGSSRGVRTRRGHSSADRRARACGWSRSGFADAFDGTFSRLRRPRGPRGGG